MIEDGKITFGNYRWELLKVEADRALIITECIIELHWYHTEFVDITWSGCELRYYLNNDFYETFSQGDKERIIPVVNCNPNNQWFGTNGGVATTDRIFLLSLEEVCTYFGDSKSDLLQKGNQKWYIEDENNKLRQAKYSNGFHWWRLRSPGYYGRTSASVSANGNVYVRGNGVYGSPKDGGGMRPALWLKL